MSITVEVIGKEVTLEKLALKAYAEVFDGLQEIPKRLVGVAGLDQVAVVMKLPEIVSSSLPELAHIVSIATNGQLTDDEIINKCGLDDLIVLIEGILEVNNYDKTVEAVKKLFARRSQPTTPSQTNQSARGSIEQSTSSPVNTAGPKTTSKSKSTRTNS